jgi:hypothetical protein
MENKPNQIEINKEPSFYEIWHEVCRDMVYK